MTEICDECGFAGEIEYRIKLTSGNSVNFCSIFCYGRWLQAETKKFLDRLAEVQKKLEEMSF